MRSLAVEFTALGQMGFADLGPAPAPGPTQVLLETLFSGVTNGTERHALMCDHGYGGGQYPSRHGYQHVCGVAAAGGEVRALAEGDVVFYGEYVGHRGWHLCEAVAGLPLMVKLPADAEPSDCALLGVAGVALRAIRRTRVSAGQRVLVVGLGPIGIFAAQCARALGAQVTAADVVDMRLEAARATGAHRVVDMRDADAWKQVETGRPYDVVFDGAGYERLFFDVHQHGLLAHGGAIAAISVRGDALFPWPMLHTTEASIEVSCHFSVAELEALVEYLREGIVQVAPMVSHRVGIEEAPRIYATMRDDPRALYGVVFGWR
jgi:L-iditol 2-dehydrogenase